MNKRAVEASSFLVGAIITIISFIVLAPIVMNFISADDCKKAESICQWSVNLRATTTVQTDKADTHTTPILCKTCDQEIDEKKEKVKEKIADMMARCWWMFGEGKYEEILKKDKITKAKDEGLLKTALPEFKDSNDCFMCYALTIEENRGFKKGTKISAEEFVKYLSKTTYKKAGVSYLQYIQSYGGPGNVLVMLDNIEPGNAYGISFAAKNEDPSSDWIYKKLGIAAAGTGGAAIGVALIAGGLGTSWTGLGLVVAGAGFYLLSRTAPITIAAGTQLAAAGWEALWTNRHTSTLYLSDLKTAQRKCFAGDAAGK